MSDDPTLTIARGVPWHLQNLGCTSTEFFTQFRGHVEYQLRTFGWFDQTRGDHGPSGKYQYDKALGAEISSKRVGIMASRLEGRDTKGEDQYDIVGRAAYGDLWGVFPKKSIGRLPERL